MCMLEVAYITQACSQFVNREWRQEVYSYYGLGLMYGKSPYRWESGKVGNAHRLAGKPRESWWKLILWSVPLLWALSGLAINLLWSYAVRSWRSSRR